VKTIKPNAIKDAIQARLKKNGVQLAPRGNAARKLAVVSRVLAKGANNLIAGTNTLKKTADQTVEKVRETAVNVQLRAAKRLQKEDPSAEFFPYTRAKWAAEAKRKATKLDYWAWVEAKIKG
jgi:hypothetical protein